MNIEDPDSPMPTTNVSLQDAQRPARPSPPQPGSVLAWLREPLLHFVILGGLVFALNAYVIGRDGDPRTIIVGPEADTEGREVFRMAKGREPNEKEMAAVREQWINNEVLYREGLAMKLDKGDKAIQDRVIFKALSVVDANVKLPPADRKVLRNWFDTHRERYDEPARYDFQEAVLPGEPSEVEARAFATALNKGAPGDEEAGLRLFKARPLPTILEAYGKAFAEQLAAVKPGEWQSLNANGTWRVIRVDSIAPAKPATFETVEAQVRQHWVDATAAEQRTDAVHAMARKYRIRILANEKP